MSKILVRGISSSSLAAEAPALASKASGSAGGQSLASMLGFGSTRIDTPLSEPLPWVPSPLRGTAPKAPPKLETGHLASGMPAIAVDTPSPVSTVAIAFEAGSSSETEHTRGASKVLAAMAFKATTNRTTFRLTRELEKIGATPASVSSRDHLTLGITALKMHAPEAFEMLLDSALNAKLSYHEFAEAVNLVQQQLRESARQPSSLIMDALHRAAYEGPLGLPMQLDPADLAHLDFGALREYYANVVKASRTVMASAGVGMQDMNKLANPLLPPSASAALVPSSTAGNTYVGGSLNVIAPSPLTHVAVAVEAKGGLSDPKAEAAAAVVRMLLDASRAVLPRTHRESDIFVSASAFSQMYSKTGLVGISAASTPGQSAQLVDAVMQRVEAVAKGVPEAQLKQAKQMAISSYKEGLASSAGMVGTMAPHLLLTGRFEPSDFAAKVDALSPSDVSSFIADGLKRTPSVVSYGSMASAPRLGGVVSKRLA
eukprot:CAMPEP_0202356414 /NCGR_PEP_ID=MMETSP1126-20121109/10888_1 /ASSEMBLY_ACC=CAM_ASM_000457 /TAXON_ID=3047 /ORGANISM="Dunaliella tertiolecta, Strain CCMP1320" /LENGTH=485 /DNA_ID=CAMNT_0048949165 /DNA_START=70 /DNA_END=1527 /DNA_ORIENTATION=-